MRAISVLFTAVLLGGLALGQQKTASPKAPEGWREHQPSANDVVLSPIFWDA
jgi:hypothetical protein